MNKSEVLQFILNLIDAYEGVIEHHDKNNNEDNAQCLFDEFREWYFASQGEGELQVLTLPRLKDMVEQ